MLMTSSIDRFTDLGCSALIACISLPVAKTTVKISPFRQEVVNATTSQWIGHIVLARPVPMRLAATVAAAIMLMLTLFLIFGEYTRKVRVTGLIMPAAGVVKVVASQFGRIAASKVKEGDTVTAGQLMFEVANERVSGGTGVDTRIAISLTLRRDELMQALQLQVQQLAQRGHLLNTRQQLIEAEIVSRQEEAILQETQVQSARDMLKTYTNLSQQGFFSSAQLRQVNNDLTSQMAKLKALEGSVLSSKRELLQVQEDKQAIDIQTKLVTSQSNQSLSTLEQEMAEHDGRSHIQIVAPAGGIVTAITLELGQTVQPGGTLATILPAGSELETQLLVPSRGVGFIEPGQDVLMRLNAFSYQKFGQVAGKVARVERSPIGDALPASGGIAGEPAYRVTVTLSKQSVTANGRNHQFKAGMTLEADILQDRRRLIEWIVDPIINAAMASAN